MSFILDALRKSETERQKQSAPGLADTRYRAVEQRRNYWIPLLVVILAANAIALAFMLMDDAPTDQETVVSPPVVVPREMPAVAANKPAPDIRPLHREVVAAPRTKPTAKPKTVELAPVAAEVVPESEPTESLPSYQQLAADGSISLPSLHVDIHVFSAKSAERFVFINMNKYREGEVLKEGPSIEKITKSGAVLNHQGTQFTIARE